VILPLPNYLSTKIYPLILLTNVSMEAIIKAITKHIIILL